MEHFLISFPENVAALANANVNVGPPTISYIVDTDYSTSFIPSLSEVEKSKHIKINLGADYNIAMIFIVNRINFLDQLVDFKIGVGKCSTSNAIKILFRGYTRDPGWPGPDGKRDDFDVMKYVTRHLVAQSSAHALFTYDSRTAD